MNKKHELFEIPKDVKRGNKMAAEAYDEILLLFNVVKPKGTFTPNDVKLPCKSKPISFNTAKDDKPAKRK